MENAGNLLMKQKCIDKGCMESLVTSAGRFDLVVVLWILGDYINRSHCRIVVFY